MEEYHITPEGTTLNDTEGTIVFTSSSTPAYGWKIDFYGTKTDWKYDDEGTYY